MIICVSVDALPDASEGEPAVTTGVLGLGKLMSSNRALITDLVMSGYAPACGADAMLTCVGESVCPCCE